MDLIGSGQKWTPEQEAAYRKSLDEETARRSARKLRQWLEMDEKTRQREPWLKMTGVEFERAVAHVYAKQGYQVRMTPVTGDQGVDIWIEKDGRRLIVQCKRHTKPVGASVVRDLLGTKVAQNADGAVLVCTAGFTWGVKRFAGKNGIQLLDLDGLLRLGG